MNNTQKGAALGAAGGAGLGAIVGHQFGHTGAGAAIGALAGTAGGALAGNAKDEADRRENYARQATYERNLRYQQARAMSNRDLVDMTTGGVSDGVIIQAMRDRGGSFDTSPQQIIYLHQCGVSDTVLQAMQSQSGR
ncbi:MAG: YMGG-like glycine zipper-containing protein [Planctomycetaceae bacterium]